MGDSEDEELSITSCVPVLEEVKGAPRFESRAVALAFEPSTMLLK
jgi:hypothetical protein